MKKISEFIVKLRIPILVIAVLLLIPSFFGILHTRINYDMLDYLPDDMETVIGQDIMLEDFGKGAFSFIIVEGMSDQDISALKTKIEAVDHVATVLWYDSLFDLSVPMELLPENYYDVFNSGDSTLMAVFFDTSSSADETIDAINEIRSVTGEQCYVSGISALVADLKSLCEQEEPIYVGLAVLLSCAAMMLLLDSWIVPFIFLASIGISIALNLGSNYFLGETSYITKALAAVLQLGVTMDYSIFLWHSYTEHKEAEHDKKKAMADAISSTITSVAGSSLTTIAGFIALCFMSYTMGLDLGIVMAKGVLLGVIGSITTLPALILIFDSLLEKTRHRPLIPNMKKAAYFITKHYLVFLVIFLVMIVPAFYGYNHTSLFYDFDNLLSSSNSDNEDNTLAYQVANDKLTSEFGVSATHIILCNSSLSAKDAKNMLSQLEAVDGVKYALGYNSLVGSLIPDDFIPDSVKSMLKSDDYQMILVTSEYDVSTDACNNQIDELNSIVKSYDSEGMVIGEAACTKDLIEVTDHDFTVVTWISLAAIFLIIALTLKSITLPIILVAVIEFAVSINLGIPFYTNLSLAFIAPISISTIQLGATVDYAILMTTRYKKERYQGEGKQDAIATALAAAIPSILVSAIGFFTATFGVGFYSDISLISTLCSLMARGALISMLSVIFVLPAMFMLFDKIIIKTSLGFQNKQKANLELNQEESL